MAKPIKSNILILGDQKCKNRDNFTFQAFMQHGRDGNYRITWVNQSYALPKLRLNKTHLLARLWNRGVGEFLLLASFLRFLFLALFSDLVVLLPCNYKLINWVALLKRVKKIPLIADLYISGALMYEDRAQSEKFSKKIYNEKLELDRKIIDISDVLIHIHKSEVELLCQRINYKFPYEKLEVIPQCIHGSRISEKRPGEVFVLAWWGMISPLHGLEVLVKALKLINDSIPFKCYFFCLPYPEEEVLKLESFVSKNGLDEKVIFNTDYTFANKQLPDFLVENVDLALGHFSDHSEKAATILPTKIVDAMSMKIPVLSRNTSAISELFDVDQDLFTCAPNSKAIASEILYICANRQEADRRAFNGFNQWKLNFTAQAYIEKFQAAVARTLTEK